MPFSRNYTITETLSENLHTAVYRAKRIKDGLSVIVKVLKSSYKEENRVVPFVNEHHMLSMLRSEKVARIIDSINTPSERIHIFEDIGGKTLHEYLQMGDFPLSEALYISIELSKIVAYLHTKKVVHTDINPKNILYNPQTRRLRLIDFGYAIIESHSKNMLYPPSQRSDNLFYMAPEQTGKTVQKVDHRTDLYSLGMTLYHLFSGELPFSDSQRDDLIHKQLAMVLPSLDTLGKFIPQVLSAIVHKLIEKKPEHRYQSVEALLFDLEKCQKELGKSGEIANFEIATMDRPSFRIGEELYGREKELEILGKSVLKALSPSATRVLISGPSGIGKTRLAEEYIAQLQPLEAQLIRCKFDQFRSALPYAIFKDIFEQFRIAWLSQKEGVRLSLDESSVEVLRQTFPELTVVLPKEKKQHTRSTYDFHHQLIYAVHELFTCAVSCEFPIILFIDDLQWADQSSIELIEHLLGSQESPYFHFIGSYRDTEIERNVLARGMVHQIQTSQIEAVSLHLEPLSLDKIDEMVSHLLMREGKEVRDLATILEKKTGGNPFYLKAFLEHLLKSDVLAYVRGRWKFSIEEVAQSTISINIGELIKEKFNRLSSDEKRYLQYLTLLGDSGRLKETFDAMTWFKQLNIHMKRLDSEGFIEIINGKYKFIHDQMQQYVYLTLSSEMKQKIHLQIGRYLDQKEKGEQRDVITIVAHLNKGYPIDKFPKKLYEMNLEALEMMLQRNAYIRALREIRWMENHEFEIHLTRHRPLLGWRLGVLKARAFYLNGEFEDAAEQIRALSAMAQTLEQKQECFHLYKDLCVTEGKGYLPLLEYASGLFKELNLILPASEQAMEDSLQELHDRISSHPKYGHLKALSAIPPLTKTIHKQVMNLLVEAWEVAYYLSDVKLMQWMYLNIIDYSLRYGHTSASAFGYVLYGAWLVSAQEYKKGYEFGQLALSINHRFNDAVMLPKVHNFVANFISPYMKLFDKNIPLYEKSLAQAQINGDIVFGTWANFLMHLSRYLSGDSLDVLASDMVHRSAFLLNSGDQKMIKMFMFLSHTVHTIQDVHTEAFEEEESMVLEWEREKFYPGLAWYAILKAQNALLNGAFESGLRYLERHVHSEMNEVIMFPKIRLHFIRALLLLGIDMPLSETQKSVLEKDIAFFDAVSAMSPKEFKGAKLILQVEREKQSKGVWKTSEGYDTALSEAKKSKNYFYIAIVGLCASRFWKRLEYGDLSRFYLNEAIVGLNQWGAYALADRLREGRKLKDESNVQVKRDDEFNYQMIIKSFSVLSKTIDKAELIKTLLQLILEHATASRAVLIFKERGEFLVYADLDFKRNETELSAYPMDECTTIPKTMIRYALNTSETIISDEPCKTGKFRNDEYIRAHIPASCMVLPVMLEGEATGVLYLENREIATPLSAESVKTLELLLTQAAIIFKNAILFEESKQAEEELNKAQEISKVGSWRFDSQTQKIQWSAETYRIYEIEPFTIEITNEWCFKHLRLQDRSYVQESVEMAMNGQKPYDIIHPIITAKGKEKIVHQRAEVFRDGEVWMMAGTIQDITESKQAEELIARLSQVVNQNPFSTIITDTNGKIEYVNPQCLSMTGFFEHELIGKKMSIFRSGVHSESFYAGLWNTISKEKKLWQGTIINRMKDGTFVDCASTIFPIFDHNRLITHYVSVQENVTERNMKDKLFIMQTRQAQMGEMLSMIAHQWRQPLAVIGTLLNKERVNLVLHEPNVDELMQNFDDIEYQVQHLSRTISDFRDFFKPDKEMSTTKNSLIVTKAVALLEHMLKQKNIVLNHVHENDAEFKTYEHEMVQVLLNLIKNAQDAFEEKNIVNRKIVVETTQYRGYSIITVEDNAGGISPSVHDSLFLPYVTTKNEQNGTGLGLYMSKTIVEDHCGGTLTFQNTEEGVKFTIKLPLKGEHD